MTNKTISASAIKQLIMDINKFREFLESEEGKESMERFSTKLKKEYEFKTRWVNKIIERLQKEENLDALFESFNKHDGKASDILYNKGINGQSNLVHLVFDAFGEIGIECDESLFVDFTSGMFEYKGYIAELICGQGCFNRFYKKD